MVPLSVLKIEKEIRQKRDNKMRYRKERKNIKVIENFSKNTLLWKHNQRGTLSMEEIAINT